MNLLNARNLKKELIITPPIEDYSFYTKKNKVYIEIEEELRDSTTYTFNFGEAIQDLSEGNKAENAVVAFSTGEYIDSFQVSGTVRQLLTQKPAEDAIITLYNVKDTLDAFTGPPMYFAKADEEGDYTIRYIKEGRYRVYAYNDANSNLKAETNKEAYGFLADTLYLGPDKPTVLAQRDSSQQINTGAINLSLTRKNTQPLVLQSSRANGKYYEFKFNKGIQDYVLAVDSTDIAADTKNFVEALNVNNTDSTRYLFHNLQDQRKLVRVYNSLQQDSIRTTLTVTDSTGQMIRDSVFYVQFVETRRQPEDFQTQFDVENDAIEQRISSSITFSKPVIAVKTDSVLLGYDTLYYLPVDYQTALTWNDRLDRVQIDIPIDRNQLIDSILFYQRRNDSLAFTQRQQLARVYLDSLRQAGTTTKQRALLQTLSRLRQNSALNALQDSIATTEDSTQTDQLIRSYSDTATVNDPLPQKQYDRQTVTDNLKALNFYAAPGSFMSVEQDSSKAIIQRYTFKDPEKYGTVSGTIDLPYENYFLQLVDKNYTVVEELKNPRQYTFRLIAPGTYQMRILVDADNDGAWEDGNILLNEEPEPVFIYQEDVEFRENWEVTKVDVDSGKLSTPSSE